MAAILAQAATDTQMALHERRADSPHLLNLFGRERAFGHGAGCQVDRAHFDGAVAGSIAFIEAELTFPFSAMREADLRVD